jgi:hypothetical protein
MLGEGKILSRRPYLNKDWKQSSVGTVHGKDHTSTLTKRQGPLEVD